MRNTAPFAALAVVVVLPRFCTAALRPPRFVADQTPTTTTAPATKLTARVVHVSGYGEMRTSPHDSWRACKDGLVLGEGAEFRTGLGSDIELQVEGETIHVHRLTAISLRRLLRDRRGVITNDVVMPYGESEYHIENEGQEYHATVQSAHSTLALRGTDVIITDQWPFPPQAISLTGRASFTAGGREHAFGGKNTRRDPTRRAKVVAGQPPAAVALRSAVEDPTDPRARTPAEEALVAELISRGATVSFPPGNGIPTVRGGGQVGDPQLQALFPARLEFILHWNADTNLDLFVGTQSGELLFPVKGLNRTASGGTIPFDHLGGPKGGFELAFWPGRFPDTVYGVMVENGSAISSSFQLNAFQNGKPADFRVNGTLVPRLSGTVGPGTDDGGQFIPNPGSGASRTITSAPRAASVSGANHVSRP